MILKLRILLLVSLIGFGGIQSANAQVLNPDYEQVIEGLYKNTVPIIDCSTLADWMAEGKPVVILDTRPEKEFSVSHITGAKCVGFESFSKKKISDIPSDTAIIVYCSVGYRSERIGEKLQRWGFKNVKNLYGGIFEWKNQDYDVYSDKKEKTESVHAFSPEWGKWLEKGKKVYR